MGSQMREKFDKYYGDLGKTNIMMLVAVVLDPRYKYKFVKFSLKKLFPRDLIKVDDICDNLYNVLKKLFDFYHANFASSSNNDSHDSRVCSMDVDGHEIEHGKSINSAKMRRMYDEFDQEHGEGDEEKSELDAYLEDPKEKRVEGEFFDILLWWRVKSEKYKVLPTMARDILAIPVSTVSSESAFSTSGRVLDQFRSSLGPKTVEALVCAQDWLRASEICIEIERFLEDVEKYEEGIVFYCFNHIYYIFFIALWKICLFY